jgi:LysR family glycine cleavage system transcriptional activator
MQAGQSSHKLTIAAPRDFTAKWLNAKLAKFSNENKDVSFALVASEEGVEFTEANLDVAIGLSDGPGNNEGVLLGDTMFVQVAAPGSKAGQKIDWPGCPISEDEETLMRVADGGLAIEAAANGFGHAWVPKMLAQQDIANGRIEVIGQDSKSSRGYWLVAPLPQWRQKKVKALVAALTE